MYRIIHEQAPAVLIESFQNPNAPQHDYNLRNSDFGFYLTINHLYFTRVEKEIDNLDCIRQLYIQKIDRHIS